MSNNILVIGAAGFIGGSVVADLASEKDGLIREANIFAAVRSEEQIQSFAKLNRVKAFKFDSDAEVSVTEAILQKEIDIVVNAASSFNQTLASNAIKALGKRRNVTGGDVHFIHSGITTMFSEEAGWPFGEIRDTDAVYEKEKLIAGEHPVRQTSILVTEESKAHGVKSYNIAVPMVYGRGTGTWRRLSVNIPANVRASIEHKTVHKFDKDCRQPATHISDLVEVYSLIIENILQKRDIPSGEEGHYFAMAHRSPWWAAMERLAKGLHARGLVDSSEPKVWPSDDVAAENLRFPRPYVRAMGTSSGDLIPVNPFKLGWKPKWDEKRFLESIDDEIQAVQELDNVKTTLFSPLMAGSK